MVGRSSCLYLLDNFLLTIDVYTDLRMDSVSRCLVSCGLENVHSIACAKTKVEVV
jgi:hypothetical protein